MLHRTSFYSLVTLGVVTLLSGTYFATNTAAAAPTIATIQVVHEANQPIPQELEQAVPFVHLGSAQHSLQEQPAPVQVQAIPVPTVIEIDSVPTTPVSLSIPSIKLNAPIIQVGLNATGEMDVPDGTTNNIGWYKHGPKPGEEGSPVLDAHVFAALKNLHFAVVGDSIYVKDANGVTRRFVIRSSVIYEVASVPRELLFNRSGGKYLNIITCAGTFVPAMDTYDHRLVVYAELVDN